MIGAALMVAYLDVLGPSFNFECLREVWHSASIDHPEPTGHDAEQKEKKALKEKCG